jgi:hypothetical protein
MDRTGMIAVVVLALALVLSAGLCVETAWAQEPAGKKAVQKIPDPPKGLEDPFVGEYAGAYESGAGKRAVGSAMVVGYRDHYDVVLIASDGPIFGPPPKGKQRGKVLRQITLKGKREKGQAQVEFAGKAGRREWVGKITGSRLVAEETGAGGARFGLKRAVRKSPTLGAKPPAGAVVLLPYQPGKPTSLDEWTNKKWLVLSDGSVLVRGGSTTTNRPFGSFKLHVEFRCPYEPQRTGQGRGNSGVYMHAKYEIQVLDSFGLKARMGDCGAIYGVRVPTVNASLPPQQWQTYDVVFHAARFDDSGKATRMPTFVEVLHNGVKIQENVKVPGVTTAGRGRGHSPTGPLMLQDHGNPVRYRNIWLVELKRP